MTLRIERIRDGRCTRIRLIGRIQAEDLDDLKLQTQRKSPEVVLDLSEVTLVEGDVVRFLMDCAQHGIQLRHCPAYVREWIRREQEGPV